MNIEFGIAIFLMGAAIILFSAKSKIPNSDIERLANVISILLFVSGILSLFFPLPKIISEEVDLFKQKTNIELILPEEISEYKVNLEFSGYGTCDLKEIVANFESGETLYVEYEFKKRLFSNPVPSHVKFIINGPDFPNEFHADETLAYSFEQKIEMSGEYRIGFIWCGAYDAEVLLKLPTKNWQFIVSDYPE